MSTLRLKKTNLYKTHKDEYKIKKEQNIIPIENHFSLLYVTSGRKSPYGVNLTIYPTQKFGLFVEYLTQGEKDGTINDDTDEYTNIQQANILFGELNDNNLYKFENTWDKSQQTLNIGMNIPINKKRNIVVGLGIGKTIVTEHKRYALPDNIVVNSIYQPTQQMINNNFYLDSQRRITSNLNYTINLSLILKPITIKIGANINDRNRNDSSLSFGIGISL